MAFLAPALTTLGGGSALAGAITLGTAAVGVYSAAQQYRAGKIVSQEAKAAAMREGLVAKQDEIERRRELVRVISARNAQAGALGVTTDGSIAAMTRRDIRDNRNDLLISSINSAARMRALRSKAASSRSEGTAGAVTSLLDSAQSLYEKRG